MQRDSESLSANVVLSGLVSSSLFPFSRHLLINEGYKVTDSVVQIAKEVGVDAKSVVLSGKPIDEIIRFAREGNFDLIVMEHTKRSKLSQLITGSIPEKVARNAGCSVLMVNNASAS